MIKLIILDRDGVINYDSPAYIKSPDEWQPIPGSLEAITQLNKAGYKVAIATNQSGVGRGYFDLPTLHAIHNKMMQKLQMLGGSINIIAFCPHHPNDNCLCRKPRAGLLEQISQKLKIDLSQALMIGDSPRDMEAAFSVGAKGWYIHPQSTPPQAYMTIRAFPNLQKAVEALLLNNE
jgi:D-glycero-D-manno-heptose 1,7-bisphosphate phosphatase